MQEDNQIIAFCGNRCDICPRYKATKSGDSEYLSRIAALWHKLGWRDTVVSNKEISCFGCFPDLKCSHNLGDCYMEKQIETCGKCDYYSCDRIEKVMEKTESYRDKCISMIEKEDLEDILNSFFYKKENLDKIKANNN